MITKSHAPLMTAPQLTWVTEDCIDNQRCGATATLASVRAGSTANDLAGPLRMVRILAFCQMIFFVVLVLFFCARAGAATPSQPDFKPELKLSSYSPEKTRDPFGGGTAKPSEGSSAADESVGLRLQGILYQATNPSAIINGRLVFVNRPTMVRMGPGEVEIKAVEITRNAVVLEVAGQKIELQLGGATSEKALK